MSLMTLSPAYKDKGDSLLCGCHRCYEDERVSEYRICQQLTIDDKQFDYMPGKECNRCICHKAICMRNRGSLFCFCGFRKGIMVAYQGK